MRQARSRKQHARQVAYLAYIGSARWYRRRARWQAEAQLRNNAAGMGDQIYCYGCGRAWLLHRDDLHHISYVRLGDERHEDLWPLCRPCHAGIHRLLTSSRSWRRLSRRQANLLALPIWQRQHWQPAGDR